MKIIILRKSQIHKNTVLKIFNFEIYLELRG